MIEKIPPVECTHDIHHKNGILLLLLVSAAVVVVTNETCNYAGQAVYSTQKRVKRNNNDGSGSGSSSKKRNRSSKFRSYDQGAYSRQIGPLGVDWKIIREQYAFDTYCVCVCANVFVSMPETFHMLTAAFDFIYDMHVCKRGYLFISVLSSPPQSIAHSRLLLLRILFWCRDNHMMIYNYIYA